MTSDSAPPLAIRGTLTRFVVGSLVFALPGVGFALTGRFLAGLLFFAEAVPFAVMAVRARDARIEVAADGWVTIVLPPPVPWVEPRHHHVHRSDLAVVRHVGAFVFVTVDVVLLAVRGTTATVKVNSGYYRRKDWLPVRSALLQQSPP